MPTAAPSNKLPIAGIIAGDRQALITSLRTLSRELPTVDFNGAGHDAADAPPRKLDLVALRELINNAPASLPSRSLLKGLLANESLQAGQVALELRAPLWLADQYVSLLRFLTKPHPALHTLLTPLCLELILILSQRPDIPLENDHPLQQLIGRVFAQVAIWEPSGGRAGRAFEGQLEQILAQLRNCDANQNSQLKAPLAAFSQYQTQQSERTAQVEQRLLTSDSHHLRSEESRSTVVDFINRRLANQALPEAVVMFVKQHLSGDMQYLLMHFDAQHPTWKKWQRLLQVLSWAFMPATVEGEAALKNKIYTLLPPLLEQLDAGYWQDLPEIDKYAEFIETLRHLFGQVIQGQSIETLRFTPLQVSSAIKLGRVEVQQSVVDQTHALQQGDWFVFNLGADEAGTDATGNRDKRRCKLLLKDTQGNQLTFVNHQGKKVATKSLDEFCLALATQVAEPLAVPKLQRNAWHGALKALEKYHLSVRANSEEKNLRQTRQQAAAKARNEAHSLLASQAQQAREQAVQRAIDDTSDGQLQVYRHDIRNLQVGAWVKLTKGQSSAKHKLSVKLLAADKYIFTDRHGQKTGEFSEKTLLSLLASGQLELLKQGESFDSSLEKVVRGLRKL